jgi:hypothetical protein
MADDFTAQFAEPTMDEALATAGTLIHWVTSDLEIMQRFRRWVEHCPDGMKDIDVLVALRATHDALSPECPDPVVAPPGMEE